MFLKRAGRKARVQAHRSLRTRGCWLRGASGPTCAWPAVSEWSGGAGFAVGLAGPSRRGARPPPGVLDCVLAREAYRLARKRSGRHKSAAARPFGSAVERWWTDAGTPRSSHRHRFPESVRGRLRRVEGRRGGRLVATRWLARGPAARAQAPRIGARRPPRLPSTRPRRPPIDRSQGSQLETLPVATFSQEVEHSRPVAGPGAGGETLPR